MRNKLLIMTAPYQSNFPYKLNKFDSMTSIREKKVNTLFNLLDSYSSGNRTMLQNQLLQIKESTPVRNMLPELHSSNPLVRISLDPRTRFTHMLLLNILHRIRLFKYCSIKNFLLNLDLNFYSPGMGLSPNKLSMHQPHFIRIQILLQFL